MYYPRHTDFLTLDYTIGTCLILICLVSTTLNPLSFLYHIQRDSKLSSRLYALLALFDFIVNIYSPLYHAYNFFSNHAQITGENVEIQARIVQGITHPSSWFSQILIHVIIFVRLRSVKYPFGRPNKKLVWICVSCSMLHLVVMECIAMSYYDFWYSEVQLVTVRPGEIHRSVELAYTVFVIMPITVIYILGGVSSIYTVFLLTRDTGPSETREQKRKSVRIILTLSIINWSVPMAIIYILIKWPLEDENIARYVGAYIEVHGIKGMVSLLDPISILILSDDFRAFSKNILATIGQKIRPLFISAKRESPEVFVNQVE